jgi:hypothetical protein
MKGRWQMSSRYLAAFGAAVVALTIVDVAAQSDPSRSRPQKPAAKSGAASTGSAAAKGNWTPPRTADGQPDLQGIWANNSITPLQRPAQWAGKQFLNDEEMTALKKAAAAAVADDSDAVFGDSLVLAAIANEKGRSFEPSTGNYNNFWLVEREVDNRTSLIVDPADGRIPPLTQEAQDRAAALAAARRRSPADGPEDRPLGERCLTFGTPRVGAGYNSYYQIVQSPGYVAIVHELGHEVRVIPIEPRSHVGPRLRQWLGDSRGRWEGDTLVVETTNFSPKSSFQGSTANLHLVERFKRVGEKTLNYEFTVSDPSVWTRPWTVMIPLKGTDEKIYEYACHEGNTGMEGILSGYRVDEAAAAAKSGSSAR